MAADADVFGILSLLLAAGGAAYLLRVRFANKNATAEALPSADDPTATQEKQRSSPTIPPKLRPPDSPPPNRQGTHPDRWYRDDLALAEQKEKEAAKKKEKDEKKAKKARLDKTEIMPNAPPRTGLVGKDTLPSEGTTAAAKEDEPAKGNKSPLAQTFAQPTAGAGAVPPAPSSSSETPVAPTSSSPAVAGATKRGVPSAAKRTLVGPVGPSSLQPNPFSAVPPNVTQQSKSPAPPDAAKAKDKDKDNDKAPASQRNVKGAAAGKPGQKTQPQVSSSSPLTDAAVDSAPPTQLRGADPLLKKIEEEARQKTEAKKKAAQAELDDIPKLDVEEDEDVEPTKVGRLGRKEIRPPVDKIVFDEGADQPPPKKAGGSGSNLKLAIYALAQTDPGKRRKQNEDSMLVLEASDLYVVADGMGGHRGGQFASKLAVKTMSDAFEKKRFEAAAHENIPEPASELARAIQMSNSSILEEAGRKPELKGMGTTICAARFTDDRQRLYIGHVGDSRCYRLRDGVMKQMTTDHTMADYGVAGPEGAHLSRALGVWPSVPIDVIMAEPQLNDVYLLCSDGLTKMLPDGTIATQLLHEEDPKAAVERLVFFANAHGGKDNITVILLRVVEPGWKPPSSAP